MANQQLRVNTGEQFLLWNTAFGQTQEAFVTMSAVDANATEMDLILKAQGNNWSNGAVTLYYYPAGHIAQIWTYSPGQSWQQHGLTYALNLRPGDVWGGRLYANGLVEMYRNGVIIAAINVSSWQDWSKPSGRAGLWLINAPNTIADNFGAGPVPNCNRTINSDVNGIFSETVAAVEAVGVQAHAVATGSGARVSWTTNRTAPIARFNLWRSQTGDRASAVVVNTVELTGEPTLRGSYRFEDAAGVASTYWLETIYADGQQAEIGPVVADPAQGQSLYLPLVWK